MKNWIMIDPTTKEVKRRYQAEQPDQSVYLYQQPYAEHREVPEGVRLEYAKVDEQDAIVEDPALIAADTAIRWEILRNNRNARLSGCDWTQLADSPLQASEKANWATYRQALRDLPENTVDPSNPSWPAEPQE